MEFGKEGDGRIGEGVAAPLRLRLHGGGVLAGDLEVAAPDGTGCLRPGA
jgi:hypothetical protein